MYTNKILDQLATSRLIVNCRKSQSKLLLPDALFKSFYVTSKCVRICEYDYCPGPARTRCGNLRRSPELWIYRCV